MMAEFPREHEAPSALRGLRGGWERIYFFFAAFILPDPQEDLLLFAGFFGMHAIAIPPL